MKPVMTFRYNNKTLPITREKLADYMSVPLAENARITLNDHEQEEAVWDIVTTTKGFLTEAESTKVGNMKRQEFHGLFTIHGD